MKANKLVLSVATLSFLVVGCQVNTHSQRQLDPDEETLMAQRSGGVVLLEGEQAPNPVGVESISTRAEHLISRNHRGAGDHCQGFVPRQPAFTLIADKPIGNVRLSAHGDAQILLVVQSDGTTRCETATSNPVITGRDWEPGIYRVYAGHPERYERFSYDVTFEDLDRPATLPWADDEEIPTVRLADTHTEPGLAAVDTNHRRFERRSDRHGDSSCVDGEQHFTHWPSLRIVVDSATSADIIALSDETVALSLVGPLPEDRRDVPERCLTSQARGLDLSPGEYFLRIGAEEHLAPEYLQLVVRDASATGNIAFLATEPPASLPEEERALTHHFPFLTAEDVLNDEAIAAAVLEAAPPELFLALAENARPVALQPAPAPPADGEESPFRTGEQPTHGTMQPNEVVLLLDDQHVLALDGLIAQIDVADLVPAELVSTPFMPASPRDTELTWEEAMELAHQEMPQDASELADVIRNFESCTEYEMEQGMVALERHRNNRARHQQALETLDAQVLQVCDAEGVAARRDAFWASAEDLRTERRDQTLRQTRERLQAAW